MRHPLSLYDMYGDVLHTSNHKNVYYYITRTNIAYMYEPCTGVSMWLCNESTTNRGLLSCF